MILRLCVERYVSFRKQPLFLYIRHIRNNLHMFSASGESFCAVVRTGAGICFPADGCTRGYCRADTYVCIGFRRNREAAGNVPADLFQQPLPSFPFMRKDATHVDTQRCETGGVTKIPPPPGGGEIMCLKYCMIEWCAMSKSSFCENITGRLFLRLLPTNPAPASSQQRGVTRFSLLCNKS